MTQAFTGLTLRADTPTFDDLVDSVEWEDIGKGRRGAVLVDAPADTVPLVRTTTRYERPAQRFGPTHRTLAAHIRQELDLAHPLDNALIEHYDRRYRKMGSHSDQALDLVDGSCVIIFSRYRDPALPPSRRLVFGPKDDDGASGERVMDDGSVIVFSLETNRRFRHKIVPTADRSLENDWLGITFRSSKTHVRYDADGPTLTDGRQLTMADDAQAKAFFALRGRENRETGFVYPDVDVTISPSDLVAPVPARCT